MKVLAPQTDDDSDPAWGPGGRRLVFAGMEGGRRSLYIVGRSGSGLRRLHAEGGYEPDWSARDRIVFTRGLRKPRLYIMRPGGQPRRLTAREGAQPSWSPSGRKVAFIRGEEVFVVGVDGSRLRRVTRRAYADSPVWAPDGRRIAFHTDSWGVTVARLTGRYVTGTGGAETDKDGTGAPAWQPLR